MNIREFPQAASVNTLAAVISKIDDPLRFGANVLTESIEEYIASINNPYQQNLQRLKFILTLESKVISILSNYPKEETDQLRVMISIYQSVYNNIKTSKINLAISILEGYIKGELSEKVNEFQALKIEYSGEIQKFRVLLEKFNDPELLENKDSILKELIRISVLIINELYQELFSR